MDIDKKLEDGYRLPYKIKKVFAPVCPVCSEFLMGNNSIISPFRCTNCKLKFINSSDKPSIYKPIKE